MVKLTSSGYRSRYDISPSIQAVNGATADDRDSSGERVFDRVDLRVGQDDHVAVQIQWQAGGRNTEGAVDGAYVEDVIWAALQRLEHFNEGEFRDRRNSIAITHLEQAIWALNDRKLDRETRGVLGKDEK